MAKNKKYAFRISQADLDEIRRKAAQANMTVTAYLTACALRKRIVIVDGLDPVFRQLKGIGANLNQLTVLCRMGRITCPRLTEVTESLAEVYSQLAILSGRNR
jgi:hypothetical protein